MEGVIGMYSIDHSVDVTIDEGWQDLQRLGLRSTVSFSRRQDGRVAMEGFPVYSTHQFQPGCQNTREWGIRFPESSGLNHNLADRFRENKKFKAFLE